MSVTYDYTLPSTACAPEALQNEIETAVPGIIGLMRSAANVTVEYPAALDAAQQAAIAAVVAAHDGTPRAFFEATHRVDTVVTRHVTRRAWYETDNGDGTFSGLAKDEVYTWQGSTLMSTVFSVFWTNGQVAEQYTETYATAADGSVITRKVQNV